MLYVLLTALGVGGATAFGGLIGYFLPHCEEKGDSLLSFAAGIMLASAVLGLIVPATSGSWPSFGLAVLGIFLGAAVLWGLNGLVSWITCRLSRRRGKIQLSGDLNRVILFVAAIALHNFPEGLAAGMSFGCESLSGAFLISGGIALQNIPEGMVVIAPMLSVGIDRRKTLLCAFATGLFEVAGTFIGYFLLSFTGWILPMALGFAGGTMLFIICEEMIPDTQGETHGEGNTFLLLAGFCTLLICDRLFP